MPYYQIEIFRTVQDQATLSLEAPNQQAAEQAAGQSIDDLDWNVSEEHITFNSTVIGTSENYVSMASLLSQGARSREISNASSYTPLVVR